MILDSLSSFELCRSEPTSCKAREDIDFAYMIASLDMVGTEQGNQNVLLPLETYRTRVKLGGELADVLNARFFTAQGTVTGDGEVEDETTWTSDFRHSIPR